MRAIETIIVLAILYLIAPYAQARDVTMAWDASTNADAYNVYRAEKVVDPADATKMVWDDWQVIATGQVGLTYTDTTAPLECEAIWVVTATNATLESGASNLLEDCPDTVASQPPAPPMNARLLPAP